MRTNSQLCVTQKQILRSACPIARGRAPGPQACFAQDDRADDAGERLPGEGDGDGFPAGAGREVDGGCLSWWRGVWTAADCGLREIRSVRMDRGAKRVHEEGKLSILAREAFEHNCQLSVFILFLHHTRRLRARTRNGVLTERFNLHGMPENAQAAIRKRFCLCVGAAQLDSRSRCLL
jgi:hypothetical protein